MSQETAASPHAAPPPRDGIDDAGYDTNHEPGLSECGCRMCVPARYGEPETTAHQLAEQDGRPA